MVKNCRSCVYLSEDKPYPMCTNDLVSPMMEEETGQHIIFDIDVFGCTQHESPDLEQAKESTNKNKE